MAMFLASLTPTLLDSLTPILRPLKARLLVLLVSASRQMQAPLFLNLMASLGRASIFLWSRTMTSVPVSHLVCMKMPLGTPMVVPILNTTMLPLLAVPGEMHLSRVLSLMPRRVLTASPMGTALRSPFMLALLMPFWKSTPDTLVIAVTAALLPKAPDRTIEPLIPIGMLRTTLLTAEWTRAPSSLPQWSATLPPMTLTPLPVPRSLLRVP